MQNGVLNATDVLLHRQPAVHGFAAERLFGVVWVGETEEIPRRTHEGVHRVGFARGRLTTGGAGDVDPILLLPQWRTAFPGQINAAGKFHG